MKVFITVLLGIIAFLILAISVLAVEGLILWGIGSLIIHVFNIPLSWGFLDGVVLALCFEIISSIYNK